MIVDDTPPAQEARRDRIARSFCFWSIVALIAAAVVFLCSGCASAPLKLDNGARLIARPDFDAARKAAPEWCRDALKTIAQLEFQLEAK